MERLPQHSRSISVFSSLLSSLQTIIVAAVVVVVVFSGLPYPRIALSLSLSFLPLDLYFFSAVSLSLLLSPSPAMVAWCSMAEKAGHKKSATSLKWRGLADKPQSSSYSLRVSYVS